MKRCRFYFLWSVFIIWILFHVSISPVQAFIPTSDPQYLVMNFSAMNEYNWAAPELEWQNEIKPKIVAELREMKAVLPPGSDARRLAWSTLMEYMNFPWDEPGPNSIYVVKIRRIFEVTRQENIPVFIPLNGFQWWDELPELYNWWDADGTQTPEVFFSRQDNPEDFRQRFIAGYNPENKWNVEWQNFTTPMNLNWRNWGGGGFRLAPPPNIARKTNGQPPHTYREVQRARLTAILRELSLQLDELAQANQSELFAGITIGTEVSLNASVTPADEFTPYGFRSIQDQICHEASCAAAPLLSSSAIEQLRQKVIYEYLLDMTRLASQFGIPKQRLYTHVWAEAEPGEPRYGGYAQAAVTEFSRPGISLYGYADKPFALTDWSSALDQAGLPAWGAVEFSTDKTPSAFSNALTAMLDPDIDSPVPPAKVVVMYNWSEHRQTPAIPAITAALNTTPQLKKCQLPELITLTKPSEIEPIALRWQYLPEFQTASLSGTKRLREQLNIHFIPGIVMARKQEPFSTVSLTPGLTELAIPTLKPGVYTWFVELAGCEGLRATSQPRTLVVSADESITNPRWVDWFLDSTINNTIPKSNQPKKK